MKTEKFGTFKKKKIRSREELEEAIAEFELNKEIEKSIYEENKKLKEEVAKLKDEKRQFLELIEQRERIINESVMGGSLFGQLKKENEKLGFIIEKQEVRIKELKKTIKKQNTERDQIRKIKDNLERKYISLVKENEKLKTENKMQLNDLKNKNQTIHCYSSMPKLINRKRAIFNWRNKDGKSIDFSLPNEIIENIDNIDEYIEGIDDFGNIIFFKDFYKYGKDEMRIHESWLGWIKQEIKKAINDGKLIIEPPKLPTIDEIIVNAKIKGIRRLDMKKCIRFFIDNKGKELPFGEIPESVQMSQTTVSKYITKLMGIGWVEQLPNKKYIWTHLSKNEIDPA